MFSNQKYLAIIWAILAALFYAINMPFSKLLLVHIPSTILAGLLYLGAGLGIGLMFLIQIRPSQKEEKSASFPSRPPKEQATFLSGKDLPYTLGMIFLDILAPVCLMYGLAHTTSANASLLNNFEIAATALIALLLFREAISSMLWKALFFVTLASILLSCEDLSGLQFSWGSLFVLGAALCWGLENNCTRQIADKNIYEIVTVKGLCSGLGSLLLGLFLQESLPEWPWVLAALLLGYVAYGLSIFLYIKAQKDLEAAKTSAYYAIAPFVGALLSFLLLQESLSGQYVVALLLMLIGSVLATLDTCMVCHRHSHTHVLTITENGETKKVEVTHSHTHYHVHEKEGHNHHHFRKKRLVQI